MGTKITDVSAHFFSKVDMDDPSGCWLWVGTIRENGYGQLIINRVPHYAHRWSYEYHKGKIPQGMVIDHLCSRRHCVNPHHLESVTQHTNVHRAGPANKTHCNYGHAYTDENTHYAPNGRRVCKMCWQRRHKENYQPTGNQPATHCKRGHLFDNDAVDGRGYRVCRTCRSEQAKIRYEKQKAGISTLARKDHCRNGHPRTEESTILLPNGKRMCRICKKASARRRQLHKGRIPTKYTRKQWAELKALYNYTCLCCGKQEPEIKLTADHVTPVSLGGTDDISNIQPLCGECNSKKRTKIVDYRPLVSTALPTITTAQDRGHSKPSDFSQMGLPDGLVSYAQFYLEHDIPETTARRARANEKFYTITGRWQRGTTIIGIALDKQGQIEFCRFFVLRGTLKKCSNSLCPCGGIIEEYQQGILTMIPCEICGTPVPNVRSKYCSGACISKAYRRRKASKAS